MKEKPGQRSFSNGDLELMVGQRRYLLKQEYSGRGNKETYRKLRWFQDDAEASVDVGKGIKLSFLGSIRRRNVESESAIAWTSTSKASQGMARSVRGHSWNDDDDVAPQVTGTFS
ncbi:hypothetical protein CBL_05649 [Carabus blaptoides fortunei]